MAWLTQFFLNPAFVLPGAALAAVPIIIHLLSRLRYKKVRFAAMEFLLQSDELNRRRLIIEQLLLLFLRVLAIILIVLLLARLVLDSSRLMLLQGATTHHVLILDDSLSMREISDGQTVFDEAQAALQKMLSQSTSRPGALRATVLLMSRPDRPLITDRALDNALLQEVNARLRNVSCSFRAASPAPALVAAQDILSGDGGVALQVHVLTDLRQSDWLQQPDLTAALEALDSINAQVSVIQITKNSADNVALSSMSSETLAVATGVPWRMNLTLRNHGAAKSSGLRAGVLVDGAALPVKVLIPDIEPDGEVELAHDITFESSGRHLVEVRLDDDALAEDNSRFLVADVTDRRTVLVVDDEARQEDAGYVSTALSADPQLTGLTSEVRRSDVLRSEDLNRYDCIYLLNVRELPADVTLLLSDYVRAGGGIAWFPDSQANTTWYNTTLRADDVFLFPVALGTVRSIPSPEPGEDPAFQHPVFAQHPIFAIYNMPDSPFADAVQVSQWFQVSAVPADDESARHGIRVLARLRNGEPVILEHQVGEGHVLTFLTGAGRRWSNWPVAPAAPGYVVMNLLMHQYLQKPSRAVQLRDLGDSLRLQWPVSEYTESVEVTLPVDESNPTANTFLRLQAAPVTDTAQSAGDDQTTGAGEPEEGTDAAEDDAAAGAQNDERLAVSIPQADRPGVYRVKRFKQDGDGEETWLALNVPTTESDLMLADAGAVEQQATAGNVRVITADVADELSASDAGREVRWFLAALLIGVLICEQLLSLSLSFHPEVKS